MGVCESSFHSARFSLNNGKNSCSKQLASEMKDQAYAICRDFLSGSWKKISSDDMVFESVTGGLSNVLYRCSLPSTLSPLNGEPSQVLLRMYGQLHSNEKTSGPGSELTTITDSVIFMLLSERKLGPKLYGIFPGGRLEEYIPARAMECRELRDPTLSSIIARKLANVHTLDVPINKEPTWLFTRIESWLASVRSRGVVEIPGTSVSKDLLTFDYESELIWLRDFLKQVKSPVVFCHNDLQEGNILLPNLTEKSKNNSRTSVQNLSDDSVILIDFEYCSYNYRAFDIANHFCEWAFDYSNPIHPNFYANLSQLPSENERRHFICEYLKQIKKQSHLPVKVTRAEEDKILNEVDSFFLATHFLWTLWSINNAFNSSITFGYWEYGKARLDAYLDHKRQLLDNNNQQE